MCKHKKELSDLRIRNISEEGMKKLIEIADRAKLGRGWGANFVFFVLCFSTCIMIMLIIAIFNPAKFSLESWHAIVDILAISVACLALAVTAVSFLGKLFEVQIIDSVEKEFQRLSKNVKESEKILLRALITMKIRQPDVSLKELLDLYPSMFNEETIVKRMYG